MVVNVEIFRDAGEIGKIVRKKYLHHTLSWRLRVFLFLVVLCRMSACILFISSLSANHVNKCVNSIHIKQGSGSSIVVCTCIYYSLCVSC